MYRGEKRGKKPKEKKEATPEVAAAEKASATAAALSPPAPAPEPYQCVNPPTDIEKLVWSLVIQLTGVDWISRNLVKYL